MTWFKVKPDFATLARMRWVEGEGIMALSRFFKIAEGTIRGYLREIKKDHSFMKIGLRDEELSVVFLAISKEEHGKSNRITL